MIVNALRLDHASTMNVEGLDLPVQRTAIVPNPIVVHPESVAVSEPVASSTSIVRIISDAVLLTTRAGEAEHRTFTSFKYSSSLIPNWLSGHVMSGAILCSGAKLQKTAQCIKPVRHILVVWCLARHQVTVLLCLEQLALMAPAIHL